MTSKQFPGKLPEKWWADSAKELVDQFEIDPKKGLTADDVLQSRSRFGPNVFEDRGPSSLWKLLWDSITSPMMLVLLAIAAISLVLGQTREAIVMAVVVIIYVAVHLLNKARSDRTMAKLRQVQAPKASVIRAGEMREIDVEDVVVGDILPLRPGSRVPADARLLETAGLMVNEAALTGESAPVRKDAEADTTLDMALAERETAVFAGTTVIDGQGKAVVMAVGEHTQLGRVAVLSTQAEKKPTPLQKEMDDLAATLAYVAIVISTVIPLIGWLRGFDFQQMVLTWLSLTFLMVPGQPPIIIAMALALAALELARKQVVVRRLQGAETLGSVNVVMSDKTGTITENKMQLSQVLMADMTVIEWENNDEQSSEKCGVFISFAYSAIPETTNNPTDLAIKDAVDNCQEMTLPDPGELVDIVGFSKGNEYRRLTYQKEGEKQHFFTGRPDFLLEQSDRKMVIDGAEYHIAKWEEGERKDLRKKIADFAEQGKRIAAYAYFEDEAVEEPPQNLVFAGAAIISDPIRSEVPQAVEMLKQAGVKTVMITGDIPETARYVAENIGLPSGSVITGGEIEGRTEAELKELIKESAVFARITPESKLNLVKAFQDEGAVVAVTGDGINDAPALSTAHIGVAMGQKGTDVAREAADLVLTDDNFSHLVDGVAIGRKAYDNFRKGITYYLSAKAILLMIFIIPLFVGEPFPFSPIQIIFTELLMDLASSTIFISEQAEPDVMKREPRTRKRFLSWIVGKRILRNMAGLAIVILAVYFGSLGLGFVLASARTAAFATWLLGHIVLAMNLKQEKTPLFKQGLLSNKFALGWLLGMILFVFAMTQWPFFQSILGTTGLSAVQWVMVVAGALLASMWLEVLKWHRLIHG